MQRLAIFMFWSAACFALVMAALPQPPSLPGDPSDKLLHILAFTTLSVLAAMAYPRVRLFTLFLGLSLFGGLIEIVQMIPQIHRDAQLLDWLADMAAVAVTLLALGVLRRLARPARANAKIS